MRFLYGDGKENRMSVRGECGESVIKEKFERIYGIGKVGPKR